MKTKGLSLKKGRGPKALLIKDCLLTGALAIVLAAILLFAAALVICRVDMPHFLFQPITTTLSALSVFFAVLLTGKNRKAPGFGVGAAAGLILFFAVMIAAAAMGKTVIGPQLPVKLLAFLCAGSLGGMLRKHLQGRSARLTL